MAKTYTAVPNVSTLQTYASADYNTYTAQNISNLIVPPSCMVRLTADSGSYTSDAAISWASTAQWDTDGMFSSGSPTVVTIQTAGLYLVTLQLYYTATVVPTIHNVNIRYNGSSSASSYGAPLGTTGPPQGWGTTSMVLSCNVSDTIGGAVGFAGGSGFTVKGSASNQSQSQTRMAVTWIGRTS